MVSGIGDVRVASNASAEALQDERVPSTKSIRLIKGPTLGGNLQLTTCYFEPIDIYFRDH